MDFSLISSIEKIVREEKDQDVKLKEKREFESTLNNLNQAISKAYKEIELLGKASIDTITKLNFVTSQFEVAQIRRNALNEQVHVEENTLLKLFKDIENVQEYIKKGQISLCDSTRKLSDECDIWALMNKPLIRPILLSKTTEKFNSVTISRAEIEQRLQKAIERRNKAISERIRLLSQPESGEDFVRIKNALRYSTEKVEFLKRVSGV